MLNWINEGCATPVVPPGSSQSVTVATIQGFECVVKIILRLAVQAAGIALFIMLLVGGFKYLTAGANPKNKELAKNTLTYAIVGLVVLVASWLILLLIKEITGVDVTQFIIPR